MIEISRYTEISNKDHTLLKNSKICELEKVRSALLKFWTRIYIFSSQVKFSKNRGVKFSTFWTPFKLKWNEKKLFVFEAEGIWCWKKNNIFSVFNMPFKRNSFYLMWLQKIHEWCWIVVTNSSNAKWRSICNFDNFTCEWNFFSQKIHCIGWMLVLKCTKFQKSVSQRILKISTWEKVLQKAAVNV